MPKFLFEATYTTDGVRSLIKDSAAGRRQANEKLLESVDGKLEAFFYAMGDRDVIAIVDLPNAEAAAAISFVGMASGLSRVRTTPLLTVEEIDRALTRKPALR